MSAREVALITFSAVEQKDAWANGQLKKEIAKAKLDRRDAALATRLCFGTLQNRMLLDYYIEAFSTVKVAKMESKVRDNLRLAVYQILFMERIPHNAAVNEAVNLTRKYCKNSRAAGMVNGILRNMVRNLDKLPLLKQKDPLDEMALRYSHPRWLLTELHRYLQDEELEQLLSIHNSAAPTTVQINTIRTTEADVIASLEREGVLVTRHPWLPDCLVLEGMGNIEQLSAFEAGGFYVQDPAAKLAVLAAAPKLGDRVLDACSAPGGKSFAAAIAMKDQGEILSCDQYPHKKNLIEAGAKRLGLSSIKAFVLDARVRQKNWENGFELVIVDAPCSGLGVIRKKPEIRYKNPEQMKGLPALQKEIMSNVSAYVKPGGV
ncbi:MAG: Ribosomal small subunit methyltransferase, partial [Evtepia sp.]|nr:Ribosomal small subunit methyltransferase [Evtepia sp.]